MIIIICLMVLVLGLLIYLLIKTSKKNNAYTKEEIASMQNSLLMALAKEQGSLKEHLAYQIGQNNEKTQKLYFDFSRQVQTNMQEGINGLKENVNDCLVKEFNKTGDVYKELLIRIARIDEAQKKLDNLSNNIISLEDILTDKKSRGAFGETNLYLILTNIFGEKNDHIYQRQYRLKNNYIADAIIFCPEPMGNICIDSKFPLEDFQKAVNNSLSMDEKRIYVKKFREDIKKHIDDIANKYICSETAPHAILFLPAEAIFSEINANYADLINYALKKHVWLTSPTTLVATLSTIEVMLRNLERDKYASLIREELAYLGTEFNRFNERWTKFNRSVETVFRDLEDLNITFGKISKRFVEINHVEINKEE